MQSFPEILSKKEEGIRKKVKGKSYKSTNLITSTFLDDRDEIRERALDIIGDLACPNRDMTGWYCKAYKMLGERRLRLVVSEARQSYNRKPQSVFGWLLKREMSALTDR